MVSCRPLLARKGPLHWRAGAPTRTAKRLLACCTIGVGMGLASCGGRAADGLEPEGNGSAAPSPGNEPTFIGPVRETCDDNPLLAGCPYANSGGGSPSPPEPAKPIPDEEPLYVAAARNVLAAQCGACHGPALSEDQASGGINYINDWERLIEAGLIEECSPRRSRIVQVMRTGEMPPPNSGMPAVPDAEVEFVAQAIELDCNSR